MENIYQKLREHLDSIPNGFPASKSGIEIEILKSIFTEEEASVFMNLKLNFETADKIFKGLVLKQVTLKKYSR